MTRTEEFKAIEGIASDVRQSRTTMISNGMARSYSYECLFRLSGAPVQLRVSGPIFIEDGETVRVVGNHDWNGVFAAVAYRNQSSGVVGSSSDLYTSRDWAQAVAGGGVVFIILGLVGYYIINEFGLLILFGLSGVFLALVGSIMFVRSRSGIRVLEKLLYDA